MSMLAAWRLYERLGVGKKMVVKHIFLFAGFEMKKLTL